MIDPQFGDDFELLFESEFSRLFRYLAGLTGDADLAADLAQEAFVRLYRRASRPEDPGAWLVSVAMNLFRNVRTTESRRARLLALGASAGAVSRPTGSVDASTRDPEEAERCARVRATLDCLPERDRRILLLRAEGYSYREIATAIELAESGVGTLLARARQAFRTTWEEHQHAPR